MRVLIYGAGAIGGYLGALLARQGVEITLLARGTTLDALVTEGLHVAWADGRSLHVRPHACAPGEYQDRFDLVFVTLKSMQLADAAPDISRALVPGGALVMIQNGLPWWYFERIESPWRGMRLHSLDPDGALTAGFDLEAVVGAVIYRPVMVTAPARLFVPHLAINRLVVGEIDNRASTRLQTIAQLLSGTGLQVETSTNIRAAKWAKLLMNLV
ncbi:MAG: hypothetical protein JSR56_06670 [Proteobacteria bacterium]|nr:hypothetical protein [Pseudomonadota bacterium]